MSDRNHQHSSNGSTVDYYKPDLVSASDYYPGGMGMPGRSFSSSTYRYGFNGKELDPNMDGNNYDYGFRIYNPQIGKFLSTDPLTKKYPELTPYQFASNSPIANIDIDGKEAEWVPMLIGLYTSLKLKLSNAGERITQHMQNYSSASTNNMGHFDNNRDIGEQVSENQQKALLSKAHIYSDFAKGGAYAMGAAASPFIAAPSIAALPELFAITGTSQLSSGSYLVQHTVSAFIDAGAQKIVNGKVDWADVVSDYAPIKGKIGKILLTAFQSSVDYKDGKLSTILDDKSLKDAAIDAFSSVATNKLFGRYNKAIESAFEKEGLKGDKLTKAIGAVVKSESEFIQGVLQNEVSKLVQEKTH